MNLSISTSAGLNGTLEIPADKSISHRAAMLAAISAGEVLIKNFLFAQDCLRTLECLRALGVEIAEIDRRDLKVKGRGLRGLKAPSEILDVGNSGTTIRLLSGILAAQNFASVISGDESIQKRPMKRIIDPLSKMGARIEAKDGNFAPLKITGARLQGIKYELPVASAQVKSAVLLAGLYAEGKTEVIEKIPSRDHTERMLEYFADCGEINIPGDISSAAFFLVGAALVPNSALTLKQVGINPTRTGIIEVLRRMGASLEINNEQLLSNEPRADLTVKSSKLVGLKLGGAIIPKIIDELPILAVAATQAQGQTVISDAGELRVKESDRIKNTVSELKKLGADISETEDGLIIKGPTKLKGAECESYRDHRIAMAAAIAGLTASGTTTVKDSECIGISFTNFEETLKKSLR